MLRGFESLTRHHRDEKSPAPGRALLASEDWLPLPAAVSARWPVPDDDVVRQVTPQGVSFKNTGT